MLLLFVGVLLSAMVLASDLAGVCRALTSGDTVACEEGESFDVPSAFATFVLVTSPEKRLAAHPPPMLEIICLRSRNILFISVSFGKVGGENDTTGASRTKLAMTIRWDGIHIGLLVVRNMSDDVYV